MKVQRFVGGYCYICAKRLFVLAGLFLLVGCVRKPILYPVCFYSQAPSQDRVQNFYAPQLASSIQSAVKKKEPLDIHLSPDARWIIANVSSRENAQITAIWPRVGCLGNALDSSSVKSEMDCAAYLRNFIARKNYVDFGNARDSGGFDIWNESSVKNTIVYCHRLKEDETP